MNIFLIVLAACCLLTGIVSYALYSYHRMKEHEQQEAFFLRLHYIALALLFVVGVVYMFYMGAYSD